MASLSGITVVFDKCTSIKEHNVSRRIVVFSSVCSLRAGGWTWSMVGPYVDRCGGSSGILHV